MNCTSNGYGAVGVTNAEAGGYDPMHFRSLISVEDRHFWFRARNQLISIFAKQLVSELAPGYRVLEMGCGDGNVLRFLEQVCGSEAITGMDLYAEGLKYARKRTACNIVQGDVSQPPFSKTFHLIGMFDVLEHVPKDTGILNEVWNLLEPMVCFYSLFLLMATFGATSMKCPATAAGTNGATFERSSNKPIL